MEKLTQILSSPVVSGIGWTLIHAIWQIAALVLAYVGIKYLTRNSNTRYWSGLGLLFAQIPVSLLTFFVIYSPANMANTAIESLEIPLQLSISEQIMSYLNTHINLVFGFWFLGIFLLILKLGVNYFLTNNLKYSKLNKYNFELVELLSDIKAKLGITRSVEIYESKAVNIPMIIGTLKPVVLIPASVLSGLSSEQLEIIIAHELAHLKRYDFTLNIVQSFVEIIFFYHPALWFLSAEIRQEREHCCDETAMQVNDDRLLLVKTLTSIQTSNQPMPLAMAFGRKKMSLLERVQHILGVNQKRSHTKESLWLLGGLMVVFMAFSQGKESKNTINNRIVEKVVTQLNDQLSKTSTREMILDEDEFSALRLAGTDTTIITERSGTSSKIQLWGDNYKVVIDGERILIDGKEQQLTPEQKQILRKNYAALKASEAKMQPHIKEVRVKAGEMEKYARQIEVNVKPMEAVAQKMGAVAQKMEEIVQKYELKLSSENTSIVEMEEISKKMAKEMKAYEVQMKELDKQMGVVEIQMDKNIEVQMRDIEKQMEIHEAPIGKYGEEMEGYMKEIRTLLPKEIRSELMSFPDVAPPPPPRPARPVRPAKSVSPPPPPVPSAPTAAPTPPKPPKYDYGKLGVVRKPYFYLPLLSTTRC
jgi:beta-lactamase regulating signal transducer with metallopeptidase domain